MTTKECMEEIEEICKGITGFTVQELEPCDENEDLIIEVIETIHDICEDVIIALLNEECITVGRVHTSAIKTWKRLINLYDGNM